MEIYVSMCVVYILVNYYWVLCKHDGGAHQIHSLVWSLNKDIFWLSESRGESFSLVWTLCSAAQDIYSANKPHCGNES